MYERILFADDGSPLARSAVPRAAAIARANDSHVLVVRASRAAGIAPDEIDYYAWDHYFTDDAREQAASDPQEAEPHLNDVVRDLQARGVLHTGSVVLRGDAAETLTEAADELEANLLVMSSRGASGLRRAVLGSVADHLIRHARETPILLSPPPDDDAPPVEQGIERVMLTLDGSDLSQAALPYAEHLARSLDVPLYLVRVTESEADLMHATMPSGMPAAATISLEDAQQMAGEQFNAAIIDLRALAETLTARGLHEVVIEVLEGDPASAIIEASERLEADVIVMATRGRGGIGRLVLGSVADSVARRSERAAVLLIRPDDD
jgi:nucleotide-binding universal stress UspA family protein